MSPEELAELSRTYHKHREEIHEAIVYHLYRGRMQKDIAADFGLNYARVYRIAKKNGITYYPRKEK